MGFITSGLSAASTANQNVSATTVNGAVAGANVAVNLPSWVQDGDLLIAIFVSAANPTTAWTTPTGWTPLFAQKNGSASVGGRVAVFTKVWRAGDPLTVTSSGPGGDQIGAAVLVRSDTDGASLTLGNPPASGFTTGYDHENTAAASTSKTMPRGQVDQSATDLRIFILICGGTIGATSAVITPPAVTPSLGNPSGAAPIRWWANTGNNLGMGIALGLWPDPSGTEAGTTVWTGNNSFDYTLSLVVHEPGAVRNGGSIGNEAPPFTGLVVPVATGIEHATVVTGGGKGGGIAVG